MTSFKCHPRTSLHLSSSGLSRGSRVQRIANSCRSRSSAKLRAWEPAERWILGINPRMTLGASGACTPSPPRGLNPEGCWEMGRRGAQAPHLCYLLGACAPRRVDCLGRIRAFFAGALGPHRFVPGRRLPGWPRNFGTLPLVGEASRTRPAPET